jgi:hypothetical protein
MLLCNRHLADIVQTSIVRFPNDWMACAPLHYPFVQGQSMIFCPRGWPIRQYDQISSSPSSSLVDPINFPNPFPKRHTGTFS